MPQYSMQSPKELSDVFGSYDPRAMFAAIDNEGLASQFRDQEYQQQQNTTQEGILKNQQSEAMNPLLLGQQRGANTIQQQQIDTGALGLERAQANQQNVLNKDQRAAALSLQDDDIKQAENSITQMLMNGTPAQKQEALKMQQWLPAIMAERRKAADALRLQQEQTNSHIGGIKEQGAQAIALANVNNAAGRYAKGKGAGQVKSIEDAVRAGKMSPAQAAVAFSGAANFEEDEEKAAKYLQLAQQYELLAKNLPLANKAGGMDVGAVTGLPTRETTPSSLELAQRRKVEGAPTPTAPPAAIAHLKANPHLANAFKAKYGYLPQ